MGYFYDLFVSHSALQAIVIIAIICAIGLVLGKIKIAGIYFSVAFVFFTGIVFGALGFSIDDQIRNFVQSFGLVLFVYALGLQVGPGFFASFGKNTVRINIAGLAVILLGTALAVLFSMITDISFSDMVGVLCGATTNTPALGAAQQTLVLLDEPQNTAAVGYAIAYPMGVAGVIIVIAVFRKFVDKNRLEPLKKTSPVDTYIATFIVSNPAIIGQNLKKIAKLSKIHFVISRLWRKGKVFIPVSDTQLDKGDKVMVISTLKDVEPLKILFGEQDVYDWNSDNIDWNAIDSQLTSKGIIITKPGINGKKLGSLKLRNLYGVNISRVYRSGIKLLATSDLTLQMGDRLVVVGEKEAIKNVEAILGNAEQKLNDPNLAPIFIGMLLGVAFGYIPILIPGMSAPVRLGLAGGPIIMGMIIGTFGPRIHMITYTTRSANLMIRGIGLSLFLACIGLNSGADFVDVIVRPEGVLAIALGFAITVVPLIIVGSVCYLFFNMDFGTISGIICGSMTNPMALNYANDVLPGDSPSISYAAVYPLCMFMRVLIAQIVLLAAF